MVRWLPAGSAPGLGTITLVAWGAAEVALRLRLAIKPGWRERLRAWSAGPGGKLREWTFFLLVLAIGGAVVGALWLSRLTRFAIGGGSVTTIVGEAVAVAGIALRVWAILTLDRFFTFVVGIVPGQRVVQHGPYRILRHPGYAGALLVLLGIGIVLANWLSLLVLVLVPTLVLSVRITVEEAALAGALGAEYLAYADRTARLIPGVW
jgi:protein-S-isoprenylcysteine O-methyltransferase Ste14